MALRRGVLTFVAIASIATLITVSTASLVYAETIRTPISAPVSVSGQTGGSESSQCGFIPANPNHRLTVSEPLVSLRLVVEAGGNPTLMVEDAQGRSTCVVSDQLSGGTIELPGAWEQGTYSIYVGDRNGASHSYTLSVIPGG